MLTGNGFAKITAICLRHQTSQPASQLTAIGTNLNFHQQKQTPKAEKNSSYNIRPWMVHCLDFRENSSERFCVQKLPIASVYLLAAGFFSLFVISTSSFVRPAIVFYPLFGLSFNSISFGRCAIYFLFHFVRSFVRWFTRSSDEILKLCVSRHA